MKIINSVSSSYKTKLEVYNILKTKVDDLVVRIKHANWFYFSRIKGVESFALKLEMGRFSVDEIDDFFACTLVVDSQREVKNAVSLVKTYFKESYRKPKKSAITHKDPESFLGISVIWCQAFR